MKKERVKLKEILYTLPPVFLVLTLPPGLNYGQGEYPVLTAHAFLTKILLTLQFIIRC
jgi:hypothetical protein